MSKVPTPAAAGKNVAVPSPLSVIPAPMKLPPGAWFPVKVAAAQSTQYSGSRPVKLTTGTTLTVTVLISLLVHVFKSVYV